LRAGRLLPPVDRVFELAEGRAAFEHLATGAQFGKVVIRIG
jgi:NADPH:quinone reductase-like Zn-dependent oxidoreductase